MFYISPTQCWYYTHNVIGGGGGFNLNSLQVAFIVFVLTFLNYKQRGDRMTTQEIQEIIDEVDENKDGKLDYKEVIIIHN